MHPFKKPFYIIGHNPNTIEEAKDFLQAGANGLEPDIVFANNKFYISHEEQSSYDNIITLENYLQGLTNLLRGNAYPLAFIIWDIKTTNFNPNEFIIIVKNCLAEFFDTVCMLMTHADDHLFLSKYNGAYSNVGIGVDESNTSALALQSFFTSAKQKNFSYADGITTILTKPGVYKNIREAQRCQAYYPTQSFSYIYTWVLSQTPAMKKYLNLYIDAIMVDITAVDKLLGLINELPYKNVYDLATPGYNPFTSAPATRYILEIKTADETMAGTNGSFIFTIAGAEEKKLESLPFHAGNENDLERGSLTALIIQGADVGPVTSLTILMTEGGLLAGWLPESIVLTCSGSDIKSTFIFNPQNRNEWLSVGQTITKYPVYS
ncbi:MAG: PLAT/LH2 domain-containing protein [Chitinophagaceae bacterium]